ncbi:hypothetical protein NMY22_g16658 [Coprinellus aureogranulatus]|nr:hypothetical protein NMY22_g16658 [Coprinellus aureogranulatus]
MNIAELANLSTKEQEAVSKFSNRPPKALYLLLTHAEATSMRKAVSESTRVSIDTVDQQLSLVLWSSVTSDARAIRSAARLVHRRRTAADLLFLLLSLLASAALGACATLLTLAYQDAGNPFQNLRWNATDFTSAALRIGSDSVVLIHSTLHAARFPCSKLIATVVVYLAQDLFRLFCSLTLAIQQRLRAIWVKITPIIRRCCCRVLYSILELAIAWLQDLRGEPGFLVSRTTLAYLPPYILDAAVIAQA